MPFDSTDFKELNLTPEEQNDLRVLRIARENISNPTAWCKDTTLCSRTHSRCAVGWLLYSLDAVTRSQDRVSVAYNARALNRITKRLGYHCLNVLAEYNDNPATDHSNIMAIFDHAIHQLEAQ